MMGVEPFRLELLESEPVGTADPCGLRLLGREPLDVERPREGSTFSRLGLLDRRPNVVLGVRVWLRRLALLEREGFLEGEGGLGLLDKGEGTDV